jgi:hypothetical protein
MKHWQQALLLVAAFAAGTLLAELLGADNTGIAMAFGQLAFAAVLVALLLRG